MKNRQTDNCENTLPQYPQKILLLILPEIFTAIFTFSKSFSSFSIHFHLKDLLHDPHSHGFIHANFE